jgi:hypothetical protein
MTSEAPPQTRSMDERLRLASHSVVWPGLRPGVDVLVHSRKSRLFKTSKRAIPVLLAAALLGAPRPTSGQPHTPNTQAVQAAVEHFLDVVGKRELDKLPALMAPKATMAVLRQREGQWTTTIQTFDEWLAALRAQPAGQGFREPLTGVSVHVEDARLAFLRADFTVVIGGEVRAHGVDYFTLVKDGEAWKILNGSYTNHPGAPKPTK